jgi:hypothetical protein
MVEPFEQWMFLFFYVKFCKSVRSDVCEFVDSSLSQELGDVCVSKTKICDADGVQLASVNRRDWRLCVLVCEQVEVQLASIAQSCRTISRRKQVVHGEEVFKRHFAGLMAVAKDIKKFAHDLFWRVAWKERGLHLSLGQVSITGTYRCHCLLRLFANKLCICLLQLLQFRTK